jgi:hypothetical protein
MDGDQQQVVGYNLLLMLPLLKDKIKGMSPLDHLHDLSQVLQAYGKTGDANVLCLVGDNCAAVNLRMSHSLC